MWWFLSMHFGFRARDESRKLRWSDVELQNDPEDNREMLVWLAERGTKTRSGQEQGHQREFQPKLHATNSDPVEFYKKFRSHRPVEMNKPDSPFYLAVTHNCRASANNQIWYKKSPLGKNEIGNFLSTAEKMRTSNKVKEQKLPTILFGKHQFQGYSTLTSLKIV
jgi:hypothetical protein